MIKRPLKLSAAMAAIKNEAHERVLKRGLVQYRLDENLMAELLKVADDRGLGYGVLARMWL